MFINSVITKFNRLCLLPFTGLLICIVFIPDIIAWLSLPKGLIFNGAFVNIDDANVYFSAIRQGAEGAWLFTPQFTSEGLPSHLAYSPYILTGRMKNLLGGPDIFWLYSLRLFSLLLASTSLANLLGTVFPEKPQTQKTTFSFILFSGGSGWIVFLLTQKATLLTPDLISPEWNTITSAFSAPHFLLGIASQAFFFSTFLNLKNKTTLNQSIIFTISGIALGLIYPFLIAVNGLILLIYFIFISIKLKTFPSKLLFSSGVASLPMIAYLIYYGILLPKDPVWKLSLIANNQIKPPSLTGIVIGFGIFLIFLLAAFYPNRNKSDFSLIKIWLVVNLFSLYLPVSFSGRFLLGLYIPVCILAGYGFEEILLPRFSKKLSLNEISIRKITIWFTLPSTILFIFWAIMGPKTTPDYPYYFQQNEIKAVQWLGKQSTSEDVILADYPISNLIPRYSNGLVMAGHLNLTINLENKLDLVNHFWNPETTDYWRDQFIKEWEITYIYQGRFENRFSPANPITLPYPIVYSSNEITIYRVE